MPEGEQNIVTYRLDILLGRRRYAHFHSTCSPSAIRRYFSDSRLNTACASFPGPLFTPSSTAARSASNYGLISVLLAIQRISQAERYARAGFQGISSQGAWLTEAGFTDGMSLKIRVMPGCMVITAQNTRKLWHCLEGLSIEPFDPDAAANWIRHYPGGLTFAEQSTLPPASTGGFVLWVGCRGMALTGWFWGHGQLAVATKHFLSGGLRIFRPPPQITNKSDGMKAAWRF
ncbi:SymE family type I addiction module toxin [Dickeya fangzhongdai]|uniref:SymE family type I addiction module toxin n=1 Tax=Dickeya fangzhongdai TaxID=1778540 RepID=UPI003BEF024B